MIDDQITSLRCKISYLTDDEQRTVKAMRRIGRELAQEYVMRIPKLPVVVCQPLPAIPPGTKPRKTTMNTDTGNYGCPGDIAPKIAPNNWRKYIRCHMVNACPLTRGDYNKLRGWEIPANENPADEGYFVVYQDGYESWCPKAQFEAAGRPVDGMTFGQAIEAMKQGKKVARRGWNGKGMYIWVMPGSTIRSYANSADPHLQAIIDANDGTVTFTGSIRMKTATGEVLTGWLASQTDMLCEAWVVVENAAAAITIRIEAGLVPDPTAKR